MVDRIERITVNQSVSARAQRSYWDSVATQYQMEHAGDLGQAEFVWGPEGWTEAELGVLGPVAGRTAVEFGCGAAQCGRWLVAQGARVVGLDISFEQLQACPGQIGLGLVQADACRLPLADDCVDLACSAHGAVAFVADLPGLVAQMARVLRPGGRLAYSTVHPIRWCLPDSDGPEGLVIRDSYFDRRPYVELTDGDVSYVQHHQTIGDHIRALSGAGLIVRDVRELEWKPGRTGSSFGGYSRRRGELIPGTTIFVADKPEETGTCGRSPS